MGVPKPTLGLQESLEGYRKAVIRMVALYYNERIQTNQPREKVHGERPRGNQV